MSGVLVQWLIDPDHAPTQREIVNGILGLADHLSDASGTAKPSPRTRGEAST